MATKYNLTRNTIEINDFYLPEIINAKGEHRSSFLLQPLPKIKSKKTVASRKNDWLNYTLLHKMNALDTITSNSKHEVKVKNNYHPRQKCLTQERQDSKQVAVKHLIIEKFKQRSQLTSQELPKNRNLMKNITNFKDVQCQNFINKYFLVGDIKEKVKLKNTDSITKKIKRFTSVCSSHNKSIPDMIEPMAVHPQARASHNEFTIEPWNFSLEQENQ